MKFMESKIITLFAILLFNATAIQAQTMETKDDSKPKIFAVLEITVHDSVMYEQYRIKVEPIIQKYGGKYLVRSGGMAFDPDPNALLIPGEGNWNPDRLIILEWESIEAFQNFINSEECSKIKDLKMNSATSKSLLVKEYLKN